MMVKRRSVPAESGGDGRGKFSGKLGSDTVFDSALRQHHSNCFGTDFAKFKGLMEDPPAYRQALYSYLQGAKALGKGVEEAINCHKGEMAYKVSKEIRKGRHRGQVPGVVLNSNSSEDFAYSIFNAGHFDANGAWAGGVFGDSQNVRDGKHLGGVDDYISLAYIVNAIFSHGKAGHADPMFPYAITSGAFGQSCSETGISEKDAIGLILLRRNNLVADLENAGHIVSTSKGGAMALEVMHEGRRERILLPAVLHDLGTCTFYVLDGEKKTEFGQWALENGLESNEAVARHISNLERHKAEAGYFEGLVQMMRERKVLTCVDTRSIRENSSAIKKLGGIASREMRRRILTKPFIKAVQIDLHFECGYLSTATAIHEAGRELGGIFRMGLAYGNQEEVGRLRSRFQDRLGQIFEGNYRLGMSSEMFVIKLEELSGRAISADTKEFLKKLFDSPIGDTRNTVAHLYANQLIRWHNVTGSISMPLATKIDRRLEEEGLSGFISPERGAGEKKKYYRAVTVEVARHQMANWASYQNNLIASGALKEKVAINVRVEDFENGAVYGLNSDGQLAELHDREKKVYDPLKG